MSHPSFRTGFTRTDLLAAIALSAIVLIYGGTITGCGPSAEDRIRLRMLNGTQIRGLQLGMVLYAQGNKGWYPGFNDEGGNANAQAPNAPQPRVTAAPLSPADPTAAVYAILFSGGYYEPGYAVSPLEPEGAKTVSKTGTVVTKNNYSYALLSVASPDADKGRRAEWSDTQNSQAPIAGDRSKAIDPTLKTTSLHVDTTSADSADWNGGIVWNDNHVTFELHGKFKTASLKYGQAHDTQGTDFDDIFSGAAVGKFDATSNALFAY